MTVYARRGDRVTCENGHTIAEVVADILKGNYYSPDQLAHWRDPEPLRGQPTKDIRCCRCGAEWVRGMQFHFEDGWR